MTRIPSLVTAGESRWGISAIYASGAPELRRNRRSLEFLHFLPDRPGFSVTPYGGSKARRAKEVSPRRKPWVRSQHHPEPRLRGVRRPFGAQHLMRLVIHPVLFEQAHKLLLEGDLAMMFLLAGNALFHLIQARATYRKGAVPALPAEASECRELLVHPPRRVGFQNSQHLGDGDPGRKG